jgi:hypothetical protein
MFLRRKIQLPNLKCTKSNGFSTLPDDGLTLQDFIGGIPSNESKSLPQLERRGADGRLRLPEWLKRDVVAGDKDVCHGIKEKELYC